MTGLTRRHSFPVMGTRASLVARSPRFDELVGIAEDVLRSAHRRFTPFDPGSELGRLRAGASEPSADMRSILAGCELMRTITDGAFRLTGPDGRVDTTGFVKGWAIRQVERDARSVGIDDWLLSVGGDVVAVGRNGDRPWQVAVQHPDNPGRVLEVVPVTDGAVATSGDSARGRHVWDRDGHMVSRRGSCTVVGPRIDIADALATACWSAGTGDPPWLARMPDYRVLWADPAGTLRTSGFPAVA